jgi:hypothetical protein
MAAAVSAEAAKRGINLDVVRCVLHVRHVAFRCIILAVKLFTVDY